MIITCPECATRYTVDAAKFPAAGRKVKCAKCGHAWHQDAPALEPMLVAEEPVAVPASAPEPEPPPPEPPPPREPPQSREPPPREIPAPRPSVFVPEPEFTESAPFVEAVERRRPLALPVRLGVLAGWGMLAALVIVGLWAAVSYRQSVAMLWPQTASLYSALGMPVNALGIDFSDVSYKREREDGQSVLAISGKLTNVSGREQSVPQLRAALNDEEKREIYHWTFSAGVATMKPGQSVTFLTRISSPPPAARTLEVRFAREGE